MKTKLFSFLFICLVLTFALPAVSQNNCVPPTGLATTNITATGATLSWTANSGVYAYMVQYRPVTNPVSAWTNVTAQTPYVTLTNLACGTQYEWQVASYCYGTLSAYSPSITFSTLACVVPCNPPTGLTTTNITTTGATLSWTAATGAYVYVVQYRPVTNPVSAWISVTTQNTSISLSNLTCGTQYEWQVASHCSSNTLSAYSPSITFSTLACVTPCYPPTGLTTSNITTTGATLSWTADTAALYYVVHYRPVTNPVSPWINVNAQTTSVTLTNLTCGTQYEWQVASICTYGSIGTFSQSITFTTLACVPPCNPPTGLTTSNITTTGATLSWTAATGAYVYMVQYRPVTNPVSAWTNVTAQTTSITLTTLTCGTQYEWQVASYCGNGVISAYAQSITFSTLPCVVPCNPPTGLTTTNITTTGATLSWTADTAALYYVVHYRPVTNPVSPWINVNAQTTSVTLTNLTCGTQYEWQVASICTYGSIGAYSQSITFSTLACVVPCNPPTGLTTTNITTTGATLSWTAATGAYVYMVQYRPVTNPVSAWTNITAQTTSITLTNLTCGTQYEWQVASYCGGVISAYAQSLTFSTLPCVVPCNPPTGLTISNITTTGATLSWTADTAALYYVVHYRPVTNPVSPWINVNAQTTSVTLSNLTCGTQYEWQVASICTYGSIGTFSQSITFTTLPCIVPCNPPTGLTTSNITTTGATLSWTAATGAYVYMVQYRPVTNPVSAWTNVTAQTTSITLTNLTCGTQYEWQVASYCGNGVISAYAQSITFSTLPCVVPCNPPTGLTTTNITTTGATLSWTADTAALYYVVHYRPVTNPVSPWINVNAQTTSVTLSNLTCGTQYEWQVASHCSSNTLSAYSPSITFSTLACVTPCYPPTGLTTSNITTTGATLSWTAATGALAYVVQYRPVTNPVSAWISVTTQNTSISLSNLTCGTQYEWQVASHCSSNTLSAYSPSITFSTLACVVPCYPPTGLTTTNITTTGATLSWTADTAALYYVVHYRPVTNPVSPWSNVNAQTTSVTLSNLTCGTQYEWQVASICTYGSIGTFSQSITFTTLPCIVPCNPPTGLTTSNITTTGATLSWTADTAALYYVVHYRPVTNPVSAWINVNAQTTSVTLSNLTCGTQYEWQVASICTYGSIGAYSQSITFSTLACVVPCNPPTGLTTSNITTTGATLSWTAATGAYVYVVQYRPVTNPVSAWISVTTQNTSINLSNLTCGTQYEWQVASHCSSNTLSAYSPSITFSTLACVVPCNPPTGLTTTNITTTGATLSWTADTGALAYMVQYRPVTNPVSPWISVTTQNTSITLTNLTCGTVYEWRIASYCGTSPNQMSIYSQIMTFSTLPCITPCNPPTGLTTSNITMTGATLSWTAATGALAYVVHYRPVTNPISPWINVNTQTPSVTLSNLTCGTQYEWQVASICTYGSIGAFSQSVTFSTLPCIVPCIPPTGLTTSMITTSSAVLSWTAPTGSLAFVVQYRPVTNPVSPWINLTVQTTSLTLSNLTCGTPYEWHVASYCGNGITSSYSQSVNFSTLSCTNPCVPPTGLTTSNITATGATLSWTAATGALAYRIQYRPVTYPASAWINVTTQATLFALTNLACGTQYEWRVASYCGNSLSQVSIFSPIITFSTLPCTVPCNPPTSLTTSNITMTGATLSWTASAGALAYMIQYRPVTNPVSSWISLTAQNTSITLTNLTCGTAYEWRIASYCGTSPNQMSIYSQIITFSTLPCITPCNPPTGLTTTNITSSGATLSWTAIPGVLAYRVQYRPVTTPVSQWNNVTTQNPTLSLHNLTCGRSYEWRVASYCGNGIISMYSQSIIFSTLPCITPCNPPTNLTTSMITAHSAILSWTAPAGALAYRIQYRPVTTPVSAWTNITAQNTTVTLSNLTCGRQYEWRVASYCGTSPNHMSAFSIIVTFSTLPCISPCSPPTGLTTGNITTTGATVSWTAVPGAIAYMVRYRPVTVPVSAWSHVYSLTTSLVLSNLTCGSQYEWQVASNCGSNAISAYSPVVTFATLACQTLCAPPTGLVTNNITTTGATLTWTPVTGALNYLIRYRPVTNPLSAWIISTTQTTSVTLSNLTCGTHYEWQVATYCDTNSISTYSPGITFSTPACVTPCNPPAGLTTSNISATGATLSWTAVTGAYVYVVQYRPVTNPASTWINIYSSGTSVTLSNLTCGTQYEWQVAAHCGPNISYTYSQSITFTTLPCTVPCNTPTDLTTSNITSTGATLSWTAPAGALAYIVQYRPVTTPVSAWTTVTVQNTSITLTNLTGGTHYEWQVRSVCSTNLGSNNVSLWSAMVYFHTLTPIVIYPNPVADHKFYLDMNNEVETKMSFVITDKFGSVVQKYDKTVLPGKETLDLDVSNLKNGVYFVHIQGKNINELQKIVIMR